MAYTDIEAARRQLEFQRLTRPPSPGKRSDVVYGGQPFRAEIVEVDGEEQAAVREERSSLMPAHVPASASSPRRTP